MDEWDEFYQCDMQGVLKVHFDHIHFYNTRLQTTYSHNLCAISGR